MNVLKTKSGKSTTAIISSAVSLILLTSSSPSFAENPNDEKCAGVVKAGLNDCASAEHICAGMNTENGYINDWLWLPEGTCNKIKGAHVIVEDDETNVDG